MWKLFVSVVLASTLVLTLSACGEPKSEILNELELMKEEIHELKNEVEIYEESIEDYNVVLGAIYTVTDAYRQDLADIGKFIMDSDNLPTYSPEIPDIHQILMTNFFTDYTDDLIAKTEVHDNAEPIMFVLDVDTMNNRQLYREARDKCTYYKVAFYQSLVLPAQKEVISGIPRGYLDGLITYWIIEIEDMENGPAITLFEPNL